VSGSRARRLGKSFLRAALWALLGWVALTSTCVLAMRWIDPIGSAFIARERFLAWRSNDKTFVYRREWVDIEKISRPMQLAVIASEDQKFQEHWGFDFASIGDALEDRERGRRTRGASTITQQTAKNLFLWPGQSWVRKGIEAYFTVLIEALWPKRRILEVYLNVAEFGKGVYGVEAAGRAYFRKSAAQFNTYDAALLAAVLPNPKRLKASAPSLYVRSRQRWIVGQMQGLGGTSYLHAVAE
jgi:monofunctional biosynthetic peptidoglycan transglycosylase